MKNLRKLILATIAITMMSSAFAAQLTYTYLYNGATVTDTIIKVDGVWKRQLSDGRILSVNQQGIEDILSGANNTVTVTSRTDIEGYLDWVLGEVEPTPEVTTPEVTTPEVTTPEVTTPAVNPYAGMTDWEKAQAEVTDLARALNIAKADPSQTGVQAATDAYNVALEVFRGEREIQNNGTKSDRDVLVNAELRRRHVAGEELKQAGEISQDRYDFDYVESVAYDFTDFSQNVDVKTLGTEVVFADRFKLVRYSEYQSAKKDYKTAVELFLNGTYTRAELDAVALKRTEALDRFIRASDEARDAVRDLDNATKLQEYMDIADYNAGILASTFEMRSSVQLASRTDIDKLVRNSHWIKDTNAQAAWNAGITGKGTVITIFDHFDSEVADTHGRRVAQIAGGIDEDFGTVGIAVESNIVEYNAILVGAAELVKAAADTGANVINASMGGYDGYDSTSIVGSDTATALFVVSSGNDQHKDCRAADDYAECNNIAASLIIGGGSVDLADQTIIVGRVKNFSNFSFNLGTNAGDLMDHYIVADGTAAAGKVGSSFAAPRVTGAAALIMQNSPTLTAAEVKDLLLDSATDLGAIGTDDVFGRGQLNLLKALSITMP